MLEITELFKTTPVNIGECLAPERECAVKSHELIKAYVVNPREELGLGLSTKEFPRDLIAGESDAVP